MILAYDNCVWYANVNGIGGYFYVTKGQLLAILCQILVNASFALFIVVPISVQPCRETTSTKTHSATSSNNKYKETICLGLYLSSQFWLSLSRRQHLDGLTSSYTPPIYEYKEAIWVGLYFSPQFQLPRRRHLYEHTSYSIPQKAVDRLRENSESCQATTICFDSEASLKAVCNLYDKSIGIP